MQEYYCHLCLEWEDAAYCETHFEMAHGQKKVTFEALKARLACLGGLDIREGPPPEKSVDEDRTPKSEGEAWMWKDEYDPNAPIITNNFRHNV
jgi:hypothetical protein